MKKNFVMRISNLLFGYKVDEDLLYDKIVELTWIRDWAEKIKGGKLESLLKTSKPTFPNPCVSCDAKYCTPGRTFCIPYKEFHAKQKPLLSVERKE